MTTRKGSTTPDVEGTQTVGGVTRREFLGVTASLVAGGMLPTTSGSLVDHVVRPERCDRAVRVAPGTLPGTASQARWWWVPTDSDHAAVCAAAVALASGRHATAVLPLPSGGETANSDHHALIQRLQDVDDGHTLRTFGLFDPLDGYKNLCRAYEQAGALGATGFVVDVRRTESMEADVRLDAALASFDLLSGLGAGWLVLLLDAPPSPQFLRVIEAAVQTHDDLTIVLTTAPTRRGTSGLVYRARASLADPFCGTRFSDGVTRLTAPLPHVLSFGLLEYTVKA